MARDFDLPPREDNLLNIRSLLLKGNPLYHCLRIEGRDEAIPDDHELIEFFHADRGSGQLFGQPFLMPVGSGEPILSVKHRVKTKLQVSDTEFKAWRFNLVPRDGPTQRCLLKDTDVWESASSCVKAVCLEHPHPNPGQCTALTRQSRMNRPLMIR